MKARGARPGRPPARWGMRASGQRDWRQGLLLSSVQFVSVRASRILRCAEPALTVALAVSSDQLVIPILQTGNWGSGGGGQPRFLGQSGTQAEPPDPKYCPLHAVGRASFREGGTRRSFYYVHHNTPCGGNGPSETRSLAQGEAARTKQCCDLNSGSEAAG